MISENYRNLLARPNGKILLLAAAGARMPQGMVGLALLLMVASFYGVAIGGAAVACYSVGIGVLVPLWGRLIDQRGILWTLRVTDVSYFAAVALVIISCNLRAGEALVLITSSAMGLSAPPLGPAVRAIWASVPNLGERRAGLAVDASFANVSFIVGPLTVSGLQYLWSGAAMLAMLAMTMVGSVCLMSVSGSYGGGPHTRQGATAAISSSHGKRFSNSYGPLRITAFRCLLVVAVLVNGAITGAMVGLPSIAKLAGTPWATGLLVAGVSLGSILGVLIWSHRRARVRPSRELTRLTAASAATLTVLPLVGGNVWILIIIAPLAGLPISSTMATLTGLTHDLSPSGATEAQSWVAAFNQLGGSTSAAAVSSAAQFMGPRAALAIPPLLAVLAAISSLFVTSSEGSRWVNSPATR